MNGRLSVELDAIYAAAAAPEQWPQTLALLADHLGVSGGMIAFHPPQPHRPFTVTGRLREDLNRLYLRQYVSNPYATALQKVPLGVPLLTNSLVDVNAIRRSAFYADILAPQKIEGQIALSHPSLCWPGGSGGMAFMLTQRQCEHGSSVLRKITPLVRHLIRAVDVSLAVGRHLAEVPQLERVVDRMSGPALLLDANGRVSFANPAAEALIVEQDGLAVRQADAMCLGADDAAENRRLMAAIRSSIAVAEGREADWFGTVRITRPSGRPTLVVLVTPLPTPFHPFGAALPSKACVLVQVLGHNRQEGPAATSLQQSFALTPAESRVAALIGSGLSAPSVASILRVSVTTVKSHLSRCFDKIEVRSQRELARVIAGLPNEARAVEVGSVRVGPRASST